MSTKKVYGKSTRSSSKISQDQNTVQVRKRFQSLCTPPNHQSNCSSCLFCQKLKTQKDYTYAPLLNKALFSKYSSSQNYYYSKDINDILDNESTPAVVFFRDLECFLEEDDYLKRFYPKRDCSNKYKALLEYYKYHKDIPRLFMTKVYVTINKFHEKKRRIEYAAIKKKLNIPDESDQKEITLKKKPQKHSDDDLSVGKLKYLLKDLKLETYSYHLKNDEVSTSTLLRDFVQRVGRKYDYLGQVSGLLSINQSNSYFQQSYEMSTIIIQKDRKYAPPPVVKAKMSKKSTSQQKINSQQLSSQQLLSSHGSFEKLNFNKINDQYSSKDAQSNRNNDNTKRSSDNYASFPYKRVYSQVDGFNNLMQMQMKHQTQRHERQTSGNFYSNDCQLKLPRRQSVVYSKLQPYQVNFLKNRVASQIDTQRTISPAKQGSMTQRTIKSGSKNSSSQINYKLATYAVQSSMKTLQFKQQQDKLTKKQLSFPIRTKSIDTPQTIYKYSPQKLPLGNGSTQAANNVNNLLQSAGTKTINNINTIVTKALKIQCINGSQTARIGSPYKTTQKTCEAYNTHRSTQSSNCKKK